MKEINIRGVITQNDDKCVYDFLGMESTSPDDVKRELEKAAGDSVTFLINSRGGDVSAGNEIYYLINRYQGNTCADITGFACSAASYLALAANKVRMVPSGAFMIHNVSCLAEGNCRDMEHTAELLKELDKGIANIYAGKTKMDIQEILEIMERETWLNAASALNMGFIDEIIEAVPVVNAVSDVIDVSAKQKLKNMIISPEKRTDNSNLQTRLNILKLKEETR